MRQASKKKGCRVGNAESASERGETTMRNEEELIRDVEIVLARRPKKTPSGRYAVYIPGVIVVGTYMCEDNAHHAAARWSEVVSDVVVVDRGSNDSVLREETSRQ